MIERLTGTLVDATGDRCVIDVGGVGFALGISASTRAELPPLGTEGFRLFCSLKVKEDALSLYGFATSEERALFERLVAVSGMGPRGALAVLSAFRPQELAVIVAEQDTTRLTQAKGIGKKTANRLILELEGPFKNDPVLAQLAAGGNAGGGEPGAGSAVASPAVIEARQALMSLGFTEREATLALEGASGDESLEALVGLGLKRLGGA